MKKDNSKKKQKNKRIEKSKNNKTPRSRTRIYIYVLIVVWTLTLGASLTWGLLAIKRSELSVVRNQARGIAKTFRVFFQWNANNGGVYVPISRFNKPNPHLKRLIPDRDVVTTSGKRLTLIDPPYMIEQVQKIMSTQKMGYFVHLESFKFQHEKTKPDPWEKEALIALKKGKKEVSSVQKINGKEAMRLMRPMVIEKVCIKCHAEQGDKIGDIRGGISVTAPLGSTVRSERGQYFAVIFGNVFVWLLGLVGLIIGGRSLIRAESNTLKSENSLKEAQKVASLGNWDLDIKTNKRTWSDEVYSIFGLTPQEFVPTFEAFMKLVHPSDRKFVRKSIRESLKDKSYSIDYRIVMPNKKVKIIHEEVEVFRDKHGKLKRMIGTVNDITERKKAERDRETLLHDIGERYKELNGLYSISEIIDEPNITIDQILQKTVEVIPPSWQYPEITCGKIIVNDKEYKTSNYKETKWCQSSDIIAKGKKVGHIFACYLKEMPESFEGPFLREERNLIDAMAEDLGRIIESKEADAKIKQMAYHDLLTKLPNRKLLRDRLSQAMAFADRNKTMVAILYLDLDGFKKVNDTYGHRIGDLLLIDTAEKLTGLVRKYDTVARIGGDEFVITLDNISNREDITKVARKTLVEIFKKTMVDGIEIKISASIGISLHPTDGREIDLLLNKADKALYKAKKKLNCYVFYENMEKVT